MKLKNTAAIHVGDHMISPARSKTVLHRRNVLK